MQTATKKGIRKSKRQPQLRSTKGAYAQRRGSKNNRKHRVIQKQNRSPIIKCIPASNNTGPFNLDRIKLEPKLGYDILTKTHKITVDFSMEDKKEAYMLHKCLQHFDDYHNKMFDNVNDAVAHVYKEATRLIKARWFLSRAHEDDDDNAIPQDFILNILYDTHEPDGAGRWQSYDNMFKHCSNKPRVKKVVAMCMNIIITKMGFSMFDSEGGYAVLSVEDWKDMEMERLLEELEYEVQQENNSTETIKEAEDNIKELKEFISVYDRDAHKLQKLIYNTIPSPAYMLETAEKEGGDFGDWVKFILWLYDKGFHMYNYTVNGWASERAITDVLERDMESGGPQSAFGYVFDGDSPYVKHINSYFDEYMSNYGCFPFMIFESYHCDRGLVRPLSNDPVLEWMQRIFSFNFNTFTYEDKRYTTTGGGAGDVQKG